MEIVCRKTAVLFSHIDPYAAEKIRDDRYVDDCSTGGTVEQVQKMRGKETILPDKSVDQYKFDGGLTKILQIRRSPSQGRSGLRRI